MSLRASIFAVLDSNAASRAILWKLYNRKNLRFMGKPNITDAVLLAVRDNGYCIIQNFWTSERCAECAREVRRTFTAYPDVVHRPHGEQTDVRIYGIEKLSPLVAEFAHDERVESYVANYTAYPSGLMHTLANIVDTPAEFGSGGQWHRDGFVPQLK